MWWLDISPGKHLHGFDDYYRLYVLFAYMNLFLSLIIKKLFIIKKVETIEKLTLL